MLLKFGRSRQSAPIAATDDELLVQVQRGDRDALALLFCCYARPIRALGRRVLHNYEEADELVHEVFLFLLNKAELFDPSCGSARAWLARISYHRALDRRKWLSRRHYFSDDNYEVWTDVEDLLGPCDVEISYWRSRLTAAFHDLTEEQRSTLQLHFFEGLTVNEIAEQMGRSRGQVKHYYYRGLEVLRGQMCSGPKESRAKAAGKAVA